jgi:hypothetical protein
LTQFQNIHIVALVLPGNPNRPAGVVYLVQQIENHLQKLARARIYVIQVKMSYQYPTAVVFQLFAQLFQDGGKKVLRIFGKGIAADGQLPYRRIENDLRREFATCYLNSVHRLAHGVLVRKSETEK